MQLLAVDTTQVVHRLMVKRSIMLLRLILLTVLRMEEFHLLFHHLSLHPSLHPSLHLLEDLASMIQLGKVNSMLPIPATILVKTPASVVAGRIRMGSKQVMLVSRPVATAPRLFRHQ